MCSKNLRFSINYREYEDKHCKIFLSSRRILYQQFLNFLSSFFAAFFCFPFIRSAYDVGIQRFVRHFVSGADIQNGVKITQNPKWFPKTKKN
jgi:hypothetical protein